MIRSPVWHQSAACASDKSVKENGANQQRVRVASVQVSSKHMQLMVQYPNHRGIRRITYSQMANAMWWKTLLQILSPFLPLESDAYLKTRLNNEIFQMWALLSLTLLNLSLSSHSQAPCSLILLPCPLFQLTETGESHTHPQTLPHTPADPPIRVSCLQRELVN